jgi:hypothetical protein
MAGPNPEVSMRGTPFLAVALLGAPLVAGSQTVTWNDRAPTTWLESAPRVRIAIEGSRSLGRGAPVLVSFYVDDNAYVTVVRVAGDGKMTILYPYARNQRAAVHPGRIYYAANPRYGGDVSFIANDRYNGYIFAIASYAPLDLSRFESRDFERFGAYSRFTLAHRSVATRPDVFIDQFAAAVLWDHDTPYDFDVDYYFPAYGPSAFSGSNMAQVCSSRFQSLSMHTFRPLYAFDLDDWDLAPQPYREMCRSYYAGLRCASYLAVFGLPECFGRPAPGSVVYSGVTGVPGAGPVLPKEPVPNDAIIRGGLFAPNPVPIPVAGGDDPPSAEGVRPGDLLRSDEEWDELRSLPPRAIRKLKDAEADGTTPSREAGTSPITGTRSESTRRTDRIVAGTPGRDDALREAPPTREPRKTKNTATEPKRTAGTRYGPTSGSTTRDTRNGGRITRPVVRPDVRPASRPPTVTGSGTAKTKPPAETKKKDPPGDG